MFDLRQMLRGARLAGALAAALSLAACANQPDQSGAQANAAGQATPGSQQDFVVNVGDRVFFETDSTDLTPQSRATLDYLVSRGIAATRMRTISYGKERPVAVCNDISCWSQNRRAVTVLNASS